MVGDALVTVVASEPKPLPGCDNWSVPETFASCSVCTPAAPVASTSGAPITSTVKLIVQVCPGVRAIDALGLKVTSPVAPSVSATVNVYAAHAPAPVAAASTWNTPVSGVEHETPLIAPQDGMSFMLLSVRGLPSPPVELLVIAKVTATLLSPT